MQTAAEEARNAAPALMFQHNGQTQNIVEGLYFGLPEDVYHAIPALSASAMKNILISPPDFYFNSWLNPLRDEDAEDDESSEWRKFGKAAHTRVLEGKQVFDSLYCVEFIPPEGCLDTVGELKDFLEKNGGVPAGHSKWKKPDWVQAVRFVSPDVLIYDVEKEKYYQAMGGRIQMSQKDMRRIELAAAMIENHPDLWPCFKGGHPEVSVVWIEEGLWFKARFDYLKPGAIVDLKTFTNMQNKPIDIAVHEAMAKMKYHIQAVNYVKAGRRAAEFASKGMTTTYGVTRFGPDPEFLAMLAKTPDLHEFFLVFQKKGGAPLARGKKFHANLALFEKGMQSIADAISLYRQYLAKFGTGVWVDTTPITDFEDDKFPKYIMEI